MKKPAAVRGGLLTWTAILRLLRNHQDDNLTCATIRMTPSLASLTLERGLDLIDVLAVLADAAHYRSGSGLVIGRARGHGDE